MTKNPNTWRFWRLPTATLVAALALAGCAGSNGEAAATPSPTTATLQPQFQFNKLGGGSSIIEVYPGTSESAADRRSDGTAYRDGEVRPVVCQQEGRWVESHPERGEDYQRSNIWYQLGGTAVPYYATEVYGDIVPTGAVVPEC